MVFRSRRYKKVCLKIDPRAGFKKVLDLLEELVFPDTGCKADHLKYALLEMINNSLRAHRTCACNDPIEVAFELESPELRIRVCDNGPGFDPASLPFSLSAEPGAIDLNSEPFQDYRRRNNFERFGMGLPLVMKTFDSFQLAFVDSSGREVSWQSWDPARVRGTAITVTKTLRPAAERAQEGPAHG